MSEEQELLRKRGKQLGDHLNRMAAERAQKSSRSWIYIVVIALVIVAVMAWAFSD